MPLGNAYLPVESTPGVYVVRGLWTGAGAANMTVDQGIGIVSVVHAGSTGEYTVTFQDVGGKLIGATVNVHTADNNAPMVGKVIVGSFSIANKTVPLEIWDLATPSKADAASGVKVEMIFTFTRNPR